MDAVCEFWVPGIPRPKGSWKFVRGKARPSSKYVEKWQAGIGWVAKTAWRQAPLDPPAAYGVFANFVVEPPGRTRKDWPFPTSAPDLDKLERTVFDALTGIVYLDDRQVIESGKVERWAATPNDVGVLIQVWRVRDESGLRVQIRRD